MRKIVCKKEREGMIKCVREIVRCWRVRGSGRDRESVIQSGPAGGSFAPRLPQTVNRAFGRGDGGGSSGGNDGVSFLRSSSRFSMCAVGL